MFPGGCCVAVLGSSIAALGPVNVTNTGAVTPTLNYEFVVVNPDMTLDSSVVSLNGLPPGVPVSGMMVLGAGGSGQIDLDARFVLPAFGRSFTVLMQADLDGNGTMDPIVSLDLENVAASAEFTSQH
jgi:hypothetical protein